MNGDGAGPAVRWRSPQVLLPALALLAAAGFALRAGPPPVPVPPELAPTDAASATPELRDAVVYLVDDDQVARPLVRELPDDDDPSVRAQALVDALRGAMIQSGDWPAALPAPHATVFELERDAVAVLDLRTTDDALADARIDVAAERRIVASLTRTLLEDGIDRVAFLRGGRPVDAWLGAIAAPATLE